MSGSNGLTDEVIEILKREKRFMSAREIFDKSEIAEKATEIAVCVIALQEGKEKRIQRINAPPGGGRVQYLYAAIGVPVPTATSAAAPHVAAAKPAGGPALRIPTKPLSDAQKRFRVGLFSDGTMVMENVPGVDGTLELDKDRTDQLLELVRR